ncbi:MAG: hypothetical protein JSV35_07585 [Candidatus Bathyarchaeota archaeon]|nr:MAG: hypothetical protein JSV35_07585 [Candidatus Bathyarchaeota archaeon]
MYLHVVPFTCWAFDVLSTLYVINILGVADELNPLGWPFGAWGALMYYIPAFLFTYFLLFRLENKLSRWIAILVTLLSFVLGGMNLLAGLHNIGVATLFL